MSSNEHYVCGLIDGIFDIVKKWKWRGKQSDKRKNEILHYHINESLKERGYNPNDYHYILKDIGVKTNDNYNH